MRNGSALFPEVKPERACLVYENVWNGVNDRFRLVREHCEELWPTYKDFADSDFPSKFPLEFHQCWFEMYLTVSLKRAKLPVKVRGSRSRGPDVLVETNVRRIWIEAVCAGPGQPGKPDSVPDIKPNVAGEVPIRQFVLRIRSSLKEKACNFKKYITDGIVGDGDLAVIAINGGAIPFLAADLDECIMRSVYGMGGGDIVVWFDRESRRRTGSTRATEILIPKSSGSPVGVQCFIDGSMAHISAVLGSGVNAFNLPEKLGQDFILYPNLTADSRLPDNLMLPGQEWSFQETGDGWTGRQQ